MRQFNDVLEKDVESVFVREVKKLGGVAEKFRSPGKRSVPDRIVFFPGGYIAFVECKAPGKKPTKKQLEDHERRAEMGFDVYVIDTKDGAVELAKHLSFEAQFGDFI